MVGFRASARPKNYPLNGLAHLKSYSLRIQVLGPLGQVLLNIGMTSLGSVGLVTAVSARFLISHCCPLLTAHISAVEQSCPVNNMICRVCVDN